MRTQDPKPRRAIGIARQSRGDGESVAAQTKRLKEACARDGLELLLVHEEQDVSGATPLAKRVGLLAAVEAVEAGDADVIVAAYFDRLMRSLKVQAELVERVEAKGGQVLALDTGELTNGSAGQWLSGTMLGMVSEYHVRTTRERPAGGVQAAIDRGVPPWLHVTPGYRKRADGRYEPDPQTAPLVAKAFERRLAGATLLEIRTELAAGGLALGHAALARLLGNRSLLGEINHGKFRPNLEAHTPIVARDVFEAVQGMRSPRGRPAKAPRLLARLGILRCGRCGARMSAGSAHKGSYPTYRCGSTEGCSPKLTIGAEIAEQAVTAAVRERVAEIEGEAPADREATSAAQGAERAEAELADALELALAAGGARSPRAKEQLAELRERAEGARKRADRLARRAGIRRITSA